MAAAVAQASGRAFSLDKGSTVPIAAAVAMGCASAQLHFTVIIIAPSKAAAAAHKSRRAFYLYEGNRAVYLLLLWHTTASAPSTCASGSVVDYGFSGASKQARLLTG